MGQNKKLSLSIALLPILFLILTGAFSVFKWKAGMHIPLISGVIATSLVGMYTGKKWSEMENGLKKGVFNALQAVFVLMIVGSIIGTWILSGTIPALIYYGLKILSPGLFVPLAAFITALVSVITGTSFTSIATVGIALMAVGQGMGFPVPLTAAAVISGAFFGDKLSPLSDTTNVSSAMVKCNLFEHVGHMLYDTIPAFLVSLVLYWFVSLKYVNNNLEGLGQVTKLVEGLNGQFNLNVVLLLLPLITILLAVKKVPAIPALSTVSILGGIFAMIFQGASLPEVIRALTFGFKSNSGIDMLDKLLSKGGITSMGGTIMLLITATALGGIMEEVGVLKVIVDKIMTFVKNTNQMMIATLLSSLIVGFSTGAQFLAIIIPAGMFESSYRKFGLHPKNLSRAVEAAGTVGITLVPWSVPAIFASNILGAKPVEFIPLLFFPMLVILFNFFYGLTGISIAKIEENGRKEQLW